MIVLIIIGFICFIGLAAVVQMASNKKKLNEMDRLIEHFNQQTFADAQGKEVAKTLLRQRLIKIKSQILADKKAIAEAADKIMYM